MRDGAQKRRSASRSSLSANGSLSCSRTARAIVRAEMLPQGQMCGKVRGTVSDGRFAAGHTRRLSLAGSVRNNGARRPDLPPWESPRAAELMGQRERFALYLRRGEAKQQRILVRHDRKIPPGIEVRPKGAIARAGGAARRRALLGRDCRGVMHDQRGKSTLSNSTAVAVALHRGRIVRSAPRDSGGVNGAGNLGKRTSRAYRAVRRAHFPARVIRRREQRLPRKKTRPCAARLSIAPPPPGR